MDHFAVEQIATEDADESDPCQKVVELEVNRKDGDLIMLDREEISQYQITVEVNDQNCDNQTLLEIYECNNDEYFPAGCKCRATNELVCVSLCLYVLASAD